MTKRRRRRPFDNPFTDLADIPLVLKVPDVSRLYRISITTIRRRCRLGTFRPRPDATNPYTWKKATILRDLEQQPVDQADQDRQTPLTH